jgi:hypothetical protein
MSRIQYKLPVVFTIAVFLLGFLSCGHEQKLTAITIMPASVHFQGFGAQVQFTALGTYIHPPETKDITNQVVWKTDTPGLVNLTDTGLATSINICGTGQVTANVFSNPQNPLKGSIIVGSADIAIEKNGNSSCP